MKDIAVQRAAAELFALAANYKAPDPAAEAAVVMIFINDFAFDHGLVEPFKLRVFLGKGKRPQRAPGPLFYWAKFDAILFFTLGAAAYRHHGFGQPCHKCASLNHVRAFGVLSKKPRSGPSSVRPLWRPALGRPGFQSSIIRRKASFASSLSSIGASTEAISFLSRSSMLIAVSFRSVHCL